MTMYCPACGDTQTTEDITIQPGEVEIVCHGCGIVWVVDMQFSEKDIEDVTE